KAGTVYPPRILKMDVEAVTPTRRNLRRGQGHPDPNASAIANVVEQSAPATAQVEDPPTRADPKLLGHVVILASLRLFQAQREITVVLGAAEVGQLSQAQPNDAVGQRIGESMSLRSAIALTRVRGLPRTSRL